MFVGSISRPDGPARRRFLQATAASAAATLIPGGPVRAADAATPWSFALFGDTHFDRLAHHDMEWLAKNHPSDAAQAAFYSTHAKMILPPLFDTVKSKIDAEAERGRSPVDCVVHVGDFIEGMCGSEALADRQIDDAVEFVDRQAWNVPMLITKGNHDIAGPGADTAFEQRLLPFLARQSQTSVERGHYAVERRGALFAMFDAYDPTSLDWLRETLGRNRRRRPTFVIVHPPIVPFQTRAHWSLFIKPEQAAQRTELLNLLGEHRAIVCCGHVHRYGVTARTTDRGPFVQLALCSILMKREQRPKQLCEGIDAYGPELAELDPGYDPGSLAERRRILTAEKPFVTHFEYANNGGHAVLHIAGDKVTADICLGTEQEAWRAIDLSNLLD